MNFENRPTHSLRPYPGNARTHSPKQIKQIARSIERFGFNNPVLVDDDDQIAARERSSLTRSMSMLRLGVGNSTQARLRSSFCGVILLMKCPRLGSEPLLPK